MSNPSTTVAATSNNSPAINATILERFNPVREYFTRLAGEERYMKEASFAAQIIAANSWLQATSVDSQVLAFQALAESNLSLNPVLKMAYFIPRNGKCVLEPSYQGLAKLLTDTGSVRHIEGHVIYQGDEAEVDLASDRKVLRHVPYVMRGVPRGEVVAFYSLATLIDGAKHCELMSAEEVNKIRDISDGWKAYAAKKIKSTPWATNYEEMGRKTVLKRHCKHLPKSDRWQALGKAMDLDNSDYDLDGWRPQTAAPTSHAMLMPNEQETKDLMAEAKGIYKDYTGADKKEIYGKMVAESKSGRQNPEFWQEVIIHLTGDAA